MPLPGLREIPVREVARRTYRQFADDDALTYAAALAFHTILALFPFLVFLLALLAYLRLPNVFDPLVRWASGALPAESAGRVRDVVQQLEARHAGGLLSAGLAGAVWAASGGIRSAMRVINQADDVRRGRPFWRRVFLSLLYTVALAVAVLLAAVLLFVGPDAAAGIAGAVGLRDEVVTLWRWLRWPTAVALLAVGASACYTVLPRRGRFRVLTPGAVVAVALWLLAAWLFRLYARYLGGTGAIYGSLGAVILLLLYLWIGAVILLVGAELDAVLQAGPERGQRRGTHRPAA